MPAGILTPTVAHGDPNAPALQAVGTQSVPRVDPLKDARRNARWAPTPLMAGRRLLIAVDKQGQTNTQQHNALCASDFWCGTRSFRYTSSSASHAPGARPDLSTDVQL
ncbi:unnamed protein product [Lota lota]